MYRMIIVTALGNYVVEMVPEKEEPTADELMKMFLETKADVESGCFMEGWTPTDGLSGAPGVFAIGKGLEILAYHVERRPEFDLPPINPDNVNTRRSLDREVHTGRYRKRSRDLLLCGKWRTADRCIKY